MHKLSAAAQAILLHRRECRKHVFSIILSHPPAFVHARSALLDKELFMGYDFGLHAERRLQKVNGRPLTFFC